MADQSDQRRFDDWEHRHRTTGTSELIPAATVVVMRDGPSGLELLMLRKNSKVAFGGMWVFPGGRIDDGDAVIDVEGNPDELATAAVAAAREATEEASVVIDPASLVWFSHWVPPPITPKRFSTFFFASRLATDAVVAIDDGEITEHQWLRPAEAIKRRDAGEVELAPPTWMTLKLLTGWECVDESLAGLAEMQPAFYETHIGRSNNGPVAMWDGDAGYANSDPEVPGARHRLTMGQDGYSFEHTAS